MKAFRVTIPLTGNVVTELYATSAEEAKEAALNITADALDRIIKDDEIEVDEI